MTLRREVILIAFGRLGLDADGNRIPTQFRTDLQEYRDSLANVTYSRQARGFYEISSTGRNGHVFYQKTVLKDDAFVVALLHYRPEDKALYDRVTARVAASLK